MIRQTSIEVREKIEPKVGTLRRKVYEAILLKGLDGMTDQEIEKQLALDGNTVRPIRGSLVEIGLVIDSGTTRPNAKGNRCIVWRSAEEGMML
jgi:transcription initiation factor IIE alpha subunit